MILVDVSGSMKGLRMAIAKHTITTILDTLGENDFVNIIAVLSSYSAVALCSHLLWENSLFLYYKGQCFQSQMLPTTEEHLSPHWGLLN